MISIILGLLIRYHGTVIIGGMNELNELGGAMNKMTAMQFFCEFPSTELTDLDDQHRAAIVEEANSLFSSGLIRPVVLASFKPEDVSISELERSQSEVRQALEAASAQRKGGGRPDAIVYLKIKEEETLSRIGLVANRAGDLFFRCTRFKDAMLLFLVLLLQTESRSIFRCARCGSPFVKIRRQTYCRRRCAVAAAQERYRLKNRDK